MYIYLQNQDGLSFAITVRKTIICIYKIYKIIILYNNNTYILYYNNNNFIIIKREHSVRTDV